MVFWQKTFLKTTQWVLQGRLSLPMHILNEFKYTHNCKTWFSLRKQTQPGEIPSSTSSRESKLQIRSGPWGLRRFGWHWMSCTEAFSFLIFSVLKEVLSYVSCSGDCRKRFIYCKATKHPSTFHQHGPEKTTAEVSFFRRTAPLMPTQINNNNNVDYHRQNAVWNNDGDLEDWEQRVRKE